jgi:NAD(P)-dependent dehydrogenase (short-subunit alcohol dehydrogenase family)
MATSQQQRVVVTGANRGIGLEFVRQLADRGDRVFATVRDVSRATELQELASKHPRDRVTIVPLDVADEHSIRAAADNITSKTDVLDLLINNAGIYAAKTNRGGEPTEKLGDLNFDDALHVLRVNAVAPILLTQALLPLLSRGANGRVVSITSGYGSVADNTGFPLYYAASKAALNQFTRSLATDVKLKSIAAIVMSPGWVKTDMGGATAPLSPEKSVGGMLKVIDTLTPADTSRFLDWQGHEVNW